MLTSDEFVYLGPNGKFVFVPSWDHPNAYFDAEQLHAHTLRNIPRLTESQCRWSDEMVALLRRLDEAHKSSMQKQSVQTARKS